MRVVATLTTRNKYHKGLRKTLDSLKSQFDEVYLGLPKTSIKGEPYLDFEHQGITIVRLKEDIGPASKLLAGLIMEKRSKDTLIVSVDDDHTYHPKLRKLFEEERLNDIKKGLCRVFTQAGVYIKYWNFGKYGLNGVGHDKNYTFDMSKNPVLTTVAGVCGVAYPSEIFGDTEDYINFIKKFMNDRIIFRNDDVLISAYISKLNITKVKTKITMKDFGVENKEDGNEKISPSLDEIFDTCNKLKFYLNKNNYYKPFSLTIIDVVFILIFLIILILLINFK